MYHLLENAMGSNEKQYAKQYRLSNGFIADAVIFGKEPLGMICIDSKFPLENYNRLMSASSKEERKKYHALFVSDVKKHIQAIQKKIYRSTGNSRICLYVSSCRSNIFLIYMLPVMRL